MRKNGFKNRPLVKTAFPYQPPNVKRLPVPKGDGFMKWGFAILIGIWMFFLGIIAGRYMTPVDFDINPVEKELTLLKSAEAEKEREKIETGLASLNEKDLDFYDDLRGSSNNTQRYQEESSPPDTPEVKRPLSKKNLSDIDAAEVEVPLDDDGSEPLPQTSDSNDRDISLNFAIQVASFVLMEDAERMVSRLIDKGYTGAYQTSEEISNIGIRYRVKIGYFKTKSEARRILKSLKNNEKLKDAYIFKKK